MLNRQVISSRLVRKFTAALPVSQSGPSVLSRWQCGSIADDLTERLRHPFRWALKHPLQAVRRLIVRLA
jgi:hypothetical protein